MEILQKGNVVKSKTSDTLMVITKIRISKQEFNKNALGYILDDKEIDESKNYI